MRTWQSQDAYAQSRHCEPCKLSSWSQAMNSQENRPFLTVSWYGHQKAHLDHCCFMRKGLEFAPQQIPQNHGGIKMVGAGGRWKTKWIIARHWGLNFGPQAKSQGHNHYTTQPPCTYIHKWHIHTHISTDGGYYIQSISYYDSKIPLCCCVEVME